MVKVYGMPSCINCKNIKKQLEERKDEFEFIDIGSDVKLLKEFIRIRDKSPAFDKAKENGSIGIPCFVKEDGTVSLSIEEFGLKEEISTSCSLEDHNKGIKGC